MINKNYNRSKYTFANINLLGSCNLDCFFCLGKDLEQEFSKYNQLTTRIPNLPNLNKFLNLCVEEKIKKIYITGQNTDSLLYQYLYNLINYLQERWKFKVGLRTNGLLVAKKIETINKCKGTVSTTMLTFNPDTMYKITKSKIIPNFHWIFTNISAPQRVATVFTLQNKDEILNLIKFVSNYPQVKYFQIRRISTDTRYNSLKEHIEAFELFIDEVIKPNFKQIGTYEKSHIFDVYGVPTTIWRTVQTTANSINYFSNGVISKEYFIIEGYKGNRRNE